MVHFSVDCLRGLFYEETIDDIDYKRKVQVQVQDLGTDVKVRDDEIKEPGFIGKKREVDYVNTYPEGPINMEFN